MKKNNRRQRGRRGRVTSMQGKDTGLRPASGVPRKSNYTDKRRYNPFDDFLFWLYAASVDFGFNEIPKNGIINSSSNLKHVEKEAK